MIISNLFYVEVTSSNYNPDKSTSITITATAKDFNDSPIVGKSLTIKKNGTDLYTGTTNNNGQISTTTTCGAGGTYNFSVKSWNCIVTVNPYPIGSIYTSIDSTSPATLFGGTWAQLTDTFLYASTTADTGTTATDGEASVTLTANQSGIKSHTHTITHTHNLGSDREIVSHATGKSIGEKRVSVPSSGSTYAPTIVSDDNWYGHSATGGASTNNSGGTTDTNASQAHNNMPPYMKVYMWKRTA